MKEYIYDLECAVKSVAITRTILSGLNERHRLLERLLSHP